MKAWEKVQKDLQELFDSLDDRIQSKDDKFWLGVWTGIKYALQKCKHPDKQFDLFLNDSSQVDDEPKELWASMTIGGTPIISPSELKPEWKKLAKRCWDCFLYPFPPLKHHEIDMPSGLQPGMLCKVKKVGEDEYKITSIEECHLPIGVKWWEESYVRLTPSTLKHHSNPNAVYGKENWLVPYLPGTNIQITCPFEEKKKEKCQPNHDSGFCPECGWLTSPSDNFCRNCGHCLKDD